MNLKNPCVPWRLIFHPRLFSNPYYSHTVLFEWYNVEKDQQHQDCVIASQPAKPDIQEKTSSTTLGANYCGFLNGEEGG